MRLLAGVLHSDEIVWNSYTWDADAHKQINTKTLSKIQTNIMPETSSVQEYIKTLDSGYTHIFRTMPGAIGSPTGSSTIYIVYIISKSMDAVGFAAGHGKTVYFLQLSNGVLSYTGL